MDIEIEPLADRITILMTDTGSSFDFTNLPDPDLDELPEGGLGVFIIKSFMDEVSYRAGHPNVLRISKRLVRRGSQLEVGDKTG